MRSASARFTFASAAGITGFPRFARGKHVRSPSFAACGLSVTWGRVRATPTDVVEHIGTLHSQPDTWVIVHFVRDLCVDQADGRSPADIAAMLMQFDGVRRRLRP